MILYVQNIKDLKQNLLTQDFCSKHTSPKTPKALPQPNPNHIYSIPFLIPCGEVKVSGQVLDNEVSIKSVCLNKVSS